ncbi:3-oxoadipyl-CoA thiolase [Reyranella sp. CPCC 100927]|uniref:3-oxoadipyl-CoA thiolase n=1 Tax=Reyranella sp. CPCC 100927 TaxID=2599616 RepID=UPI0011B80CD9|nr:3-oxoadipyl-CoA thiolase [Reyranella sp. CPCC 100927]TWT14941.1 3-oxoadipyl-CoA thiolase [Reyranella sp. CPCC 100927]
MTDAFICDTVRTPIGRYNGALSSVRTDDLAALPLKALMTRNPGVDWGAVDDIVYGCVNQAGEDNRNVARMAGLLAGLPVEVAGATVNRLCGSGIEATAAAARAIKTGEAQIMIAGGVEGMTRSPYVMGKPAQGFDRSMKLEDTVLGWRFVNAAMKARYGVDAMGQTAENVAQEHQISRVDQDAFAYRSQQRCKKATERGFFKKELIPVTVKKGKTESVVEADEHPRFDTTMEGLSKLPPAFHEEGSVTAGNSSGINDGACAMIIASEKAAKGQGLTPRARVIATAAAGVPPRVMGIGPVPASRKVLEIAGLKISDMDVVELNEAFAAQGLAVMRQLGLSDCADHVNANGGAIALGHPLGASGGRLIMTAINQLEATGGRYALCTMCIGVGQGIAMVIERV